MKKTKPKRYSKKINMLRKTFINDDMVKIIQNKDLFIFLDVFSEKQIKDFCYVWKIRAKKEPCIIEAIYRTQYIDSINIWTIWKAFEDLVKKEQLLLPYKII